MLAQTGALHWMRLPMRHQKSKQQSKQTERFLNLTCKNCNASTHVTQILGTRLDLSASIRQATTRIQVMAWL